MAGKKRYRHGESIGNGSKLYAVWCNMLSRCKNPSQVGYARYGGRGICVCERWHVFENFKADMGEPPQGYQLDRINNNGNYEPANCRWANRGDQMLNTCRSLGLRTIDDDPISLTGIASWLAINPDSLRKLLRRSGVLSAAR